MHDQATLILAIIGALIIWTSSIVAMVSWLNGKFRSMESLVYKETGRNRERTDKRVDRHAVRIQRLESKAFGVTRSGEYEDGDENLL